MTRLLIVQIFTISLMLYGCGPGGAGSLSQNASDQSGSSLVVDPSLSNGQPMSFLQEHPEEVPVVQCDDRNLGVVICHVPPGNPPAALG